MNGTYYTITEVFDFGPHISKVILDYGKSMKGAVPSPEQFTVHVTRTSTEGEDFVWPNFMGDKPDDSMDGTRRVSNVYVSDKTGAPCEDGTCLTLDHFQYWFKSVRFGYKMVLKQPGGNRKVLFSRQVWRCAFGRAGFLEILYNGRNRENPAHV